MKISKPTKLSGKTKQTIAKLMDSDFVADVFNKKLSDYYPDFVKVIDINLKPFKKHLGLTSAVFVVEYKINYQSPDGQKKALNIFASAHSDGSRQGAYEKTKLLYEHGFNAGKYRVTRPLFFLPEQKAFVYEASLGQSFFNFFSQDPQADLESILKLIAAWAKKLHALEIDSQKFVWGDFRIENMVPAPKVFMADFISRDKKQGELVTDLVERMKKLESIFDKQIKKGIIYGDYHPENIIIRDLQADYLEMIDFTDIAFGDPMTDLGAFLQQFDFMGHSFISRKKINDYKQYFVEAYFGKALDKIEAEFFARINLYQSWTALRTAVFLFYMEDPENPIDDLLQDALGHLKLSETQQKEINLYHHHD
ncbi:MAG: phosphotransferase [bacterium]|nr:phosphotransferase [bacterium]